MLRIRISPVLVWSSARDAPHEAFPLPEGCDEAYVVANGVRLLKWRITTTSQFGNDLGDEANILEKEGCDACAL